MSTSKQLLNAIDDLNNLLRSLVKKESEVGKSFRSRCRELPSLIEEVGVVPALSFAYGKATKKTYDDVKTKLKNKDNIDDNNQIEKAYGIYLYFILKRLKDFNLINEEQLNDPVKALDELAKGKQGVASKLLRPYMAELKKLSEAVFEVEGERE